MAKAKKEKTFKIRKCPECESDNVGVVVGKEKKGEWECHKCSWNGTDVKEVILGEEELMEYMDSHGEQVS